MASDDKADSQDTPRPAADAASREGGSPQNPGAIPWSKLLQQGKRGFSALEETLRYEFHPRSLREEHQSLGDTLLEMGAISEAQLEEARDEQRKSGRLLGDILISRRFITPDTKAHAVARQYNMDFASLEETASSVAALEAVSENLAQRYQLLPAALDGDKLTVLITYPQQRESLNEVGVLLGLRVQALLTAAEDMASTIEARYAKLAELRASGKIGAKGQVGGTRRQGNRKRLEAAPSTSKPHPAANAAQRHTEAAMPPSEQDRESAPRAKVEAPRFDNIAQQAAGASVVKMVSTIIEGAVDSGATDIHLDPQDPDMRVRYRIDGILHDIMTIPADLEAAVVSRVKIMSDLDITESRLPQDGHISTEIHGKEFDLRIATLPTFLGERLVIRLLDQSTVLNGIGDLGLESEDEERLTRLINQPYGMILVTGPTGSGKTTTLYAALNEKNVETDSIVTLEDPVEYQLSGINQVQVDPDIGRSFANTLRAALRQDIDVLLVGEIRDAETAHIAIRAAMTGHLVFSTLHTNDAPEAISTLRNMGIPSYLISSALTAVIAQRLVRTICPDCREAYRPDAQLLQSIGLPKSTEKLYHGVGCEACFKTGNRGRTGIFEVLEVTQEVRKWIAKDRSVEQIAQDAHLATMAARCRQKVLDGVITPQEFLRVIRT